MSRRVARTVRKQDVGAAKTRSFVVPSSNDTYVHPVDSQGLSKNTAIEFSTRVGDNGRVVVVPYSGSASANSVAIGSSSLQVDAPEVAAANNLKVESMATGVNAYYVAYLHSGASVTFGAKTYVNPNVNVDSASAPTERSSQIIVVRYSLTHAVQDSFALTGVASASRRDVQSQVRLAHYSGVPNSVYVTGRFKGLLTDGAGDMVTSAANGATNTDYALFCVRVEQNSSSGALSVDWMNTVGATATGSGSTAAVTANDAVVVDDMGNAFVAFTAAYTHAANGVLSVTSLSSSSGATFTQAVSGTLSANAAFVHVFKLLGASGVVDQTHSGNVAGTATSGNETFDALVMCNESTNVLGLLSHTSANVMSLEVFDVSNGASTSVKAVGADSNDGVMAYDVSNNRFMVAHKVAAANNFSVSSFPLSGTTLSDEVLIAGAGGSLSSAVQALQLGSVSVSAVGTSTNVYVSFDYALTSSTVYLINGSAANTSLTLPTTGAAAAYNSAVLAGVTTGSAANWTPQSLAHFDQSNASTVGNNRVRAATDISGNRLALALGFNSDLRYTDGSGTARTLNGNTGTSVSLDRGSSNCVVMINMSASESENRPLGVFDSYNSGNLTCNVRLFTPGKVLSYAGTSTTLSAGNNYYLDALSGALTTTATSNLLIGFAVSSSELMITNYPKVA